MMAMGAKRALSVALGIVVCGASAVASAQAPSASSPQGRSWEEIAQLPDWGGVWQYDFGGGTHTVSEPELTARAAAQSQAYIDGRARGENLQTPAANCIPHGLIGIMSQPYPIEFLFTPGKVTIAIETFSQMRRIFTDGRSHPEDPDLLWHGNSIGRWDGDTLIVDTVGLDPAAPFGVRDGPPGITLSEQAHVVERIRVADDGRLEIMTTVEDPEAFLEPWTFARYYERHRDWDIREYICQQNNRDGADEQGRPSMTFD